MGDNIVKAFAAFQRVNGFAEEPAVTAASWRGLLDLGKASGDASKAPLLVHPKASGEAGQSQSGGAREGEASPAEAQNTDQNALIQISIPEAALKGPFAKRIPESMKAQTRLHRLSYRNADEELGEIYHSSPELLHALNPGMKFKNLGQRIWVPNIHSEKPEGEAAKVVADKRFAEVAVYGDDNRVLAVYPATIGSAEKPTPGWRNGSGEGDTRSLVHLRSTALALQGSENRGCYGLLRGRTILWVWRGSPWPKRAMAFTALPTRPRSARRPLTDALGSPTGTRWSFPALSSPALRLLSKADPGAKPRRRRVGAMLWRKFCDIGRVTLPCDKHAILADSNPIVTLGIKGLRSDHSATPIAAILKCICAIVDRIAEGIDVVTVCQRRGKAQAMAVAILRHDVLQLVRHGFCCPHRIFRCRRRSQMAKKIASGCSCSFARTVDGIRDQRLSTSLKSRAGWTSASRIWKIGLLGALSARCLLRIL